jgi:ABC-type transport system substrate-binding protein
MSADPGRSGPSRPRAGVPSRLALGVVSVRRTSSSGVWVAMALACACAHAADPNKVLRVEFYVAETGFDPVKVQDYFSHTVNEAIFEPLLTYDYLARPAKLVPRAAESMPVVSDQARTYVFKIRKGIYFAADAAFKGK